MPAIQNIYLTRAKYTAYQEQLRYMEAEGERQLAKLLASSPGSGIGRPLDLPIHDLARSFYAERDDIRAKLGRTKIIEDYVATLESTSRIEIGAKVTLVDLETGDILTYTIVGPDESDPRAGRISYVSPLGASLLGKQENELVPMQSTGANFRIKHLEFTPFTFSYTPKDWDSILRNVAA